MLLPDLDGFLAGVLVCPKPIPSEEWLPVVWGSDDGWFETVEQRTELTRLIMEHLDCLSAGLKDGTDPFAPIFAVDDRDEIDLWEVWIDGFEAAMRLRPESWGAFLQADDQTRSALTSLMAYADVGRRSTDLQPAEIEELGQEAFERIGECVDILYAWKIGEPWRYRPREPYRAPVKVGRNERCPCGSGKKYKKCCGANVN